MAKEDDDPKDKIGTRLEFRSLTAGGGIVRVKTADTEKPASTKKS